MESHENERDEKYDSLREFKDFVQRKQKELHIIFENLKIKNIIEILTENYRKFLLLDSQTYESLENIEKVFKELSEVLKKESEKLQLDKNLKKGLELVLEWYRIKSIEICLRPKAVFLSYPRTREEEKKEDADQKNAFIKKIENVSEDVRAFNQHLRKSHKEYTVRLAIDFSCDELETLFEPLVREENGFENKVENSSFFKSYHAERDMLVKNVTKLNIELLERIQVFTRSRDDARKDRLEKISAFLGKKNTYSVDVYYLKHFYESKNEAEKKIIEAYKKINEKNLKYERIRELKTESDKLDIPLRAFLANLSNYALSYLEAGYYYIQSGHLYLEAINKIATLLKNDSADFSNNAKILDQMRDCEVEYQFFETKFPEARKIVENQYIELAGQCTKEICSKKLIDLKIFEAEEKTNRRKEIHEFIQQFKLKVTSDDIDPIRFKELHRRKLNDAWKNTFDVVLKNAFEPKIKNFKIIKKNNSKAAALRSAKQLQEEMLQSKSQIFLKCVSHLSDDKKNKIQSIVDQAYSQVPLLEQLHVFIQETEKKLIENEMKRKAENTPPPSKWMRISNFFSMILQSFKDLFRYCMGCCRCSSKISVRSSHRNAKPGFPFLSSHSKIPFKSTEPIKESSSHGKVSRSKADFLDPEALPRDDVCLKTYRN